jgi:hypothetical protein
MKEYGIFSLGMALFFLIMAITHSLIWIIGAISITPIAWQFLSKDILGKKCNVITKGRVINIQTSGIFVNRLPLYNADIAYLDRMKTFKSLPTNFIHDVSPGDIIEIKYNEKKPHIAFINFTN